MKKTISLFGVFITCILRIYAQEHEVTGLVYDKDSEQRLTRVHITNIKTQEGFYNNVKGEFTTQAATGDTLELHLSGYYTEKAVVGPQRSLIIYLRRNSIQLKQVDITEKAISPSAKHEQNMRDYRDIYRKGNSRDIFSMGGANGLEGAGLSIDALYSLFSREGKNARYLQKIIERDYKNSIIDYRYNKTLINLTTGLSGEPLIDFMNQYRPSYQFILQASEYQLINYIKVNYQRYLANPSAYRLQPLTNQK